MKIIDINGNERECANVYPDKDYSGFMKLEFSNKLRSYSEWYPIEEFKAKNPSLEYLIKGAQGETEDSLGVVSKSTDMGLTDIKQKWAKDAYAGFPMWISRGKGEGQVRTVTSNSKNSVIINQPWDIIPDNTSQYVISHNVHNPHIFGNSLPQVQKNPKKKAKKKI
jgi:hypothetical protein